MKDIGLVLSGGGARAMAQVGSLQALNEHGIFPTKVAGTSAGALIGALYCSGYSPSEILQLSQTHSFLKVFKLGLINKGITEMTRLKTFLYNHIKIKFENLDIPLFISVTNLNTGNYEIVSSGELLDYVVASCSIPVLFKPTSINKCLYADGGLMNNFPIEPFLGQTDFIVGVSVTAHHYLPELKGRLQIAERCFQLAVYSTMKNRMDQCDFLMEIEDVFGYGLFSIKKSEELYQIGYETTIKKIPEIKDLLNLT